MEIAKGGNRQQKLVMIGGGVVVILLSFTMLGSFSKKSPFESLTAQMESLMKKGDYATALKKAQARVDFAEKNFEPAAPQITDSYHDMGAVLAADGKFDEAKRWVVKSISMELEARGKKAPALPEKLVTLAEVQEGLGDHASAQAAGQEAIKYFKDLPPEKKLRDRARGYAVTASASLSQNRCEDALEFAESGLKLSNGINKEFDILQSLNTSAGRAQLCLQHPELAADYVKDAIAFAKKQKGGTDPELPLLTSLEGQILCATGKCKLGVKKENDAYKMARKLYGDDSPKAAEFLPKDAVEKAEKPEKASKRAKAEFASSSEAEPAERPNGSHFENF